MRVVRAVLLVLIGLSCVGCPPRRGARLPPAIELAQRRMHRLRLVAPDVIAEADAALRLAQRAQEADDRDAARAHVERALVWVDVAEAAAREASLDSARLASESRRRNARLRASRTEAERLAITAELLRLDAARTAHAAIAAARRRADAAEARRSPRAARERAEARTELGRRLLEDAATHLAAAEAMEPAPAGTREARAAFAAAELLGQRIGATSGPPNATAAARFRDAASHAAELAAALVAEAPHP